MEGRSSNAGATAVFSGARPTLPGWCRSARDGGQHEWGTKLRGNRHARDAGAARASRRASSQVHRGTPWPRGI